MLPQRFIESSCLKCHHQVTDLISSDNRNEAPKVLRGYNLIKENGCFGCHEINGRKGGRQVGPDIRLEPFPPRDDLTTAEVVKLDADPDSPFGAIGPAFRRVHDFREHVGELDELLTALEARAREVRTSRILESAVRPLE